jgi:hypothetical protein
MMRLARLDFECVCECASAIHWQNVSTLNWAGYVMSIFYFEKIRVFKAGICYEYISME